MKRVLCLTSVLLLLVAVPSAQQIGVQQVSAQDAGACATANACAIFSLPKASSVALQVAGTFSGTLTFEATSDGRNWQSVSLLAASDGATLSSTTAAPGIFSLGNTGFVQLRARATAWSSGTATVTAVRGDGFVHSSTGGGGNGITTLTGDVTAGPGSGSQAATIASGAVTLGKMANLADQTIIGRSGGAGAPQALTVLPTGAVPAFTGDVTNSAGSLALTIGAGKVLFSNMAAQTSAQVFGWVSDEVGGGGKLMGNASPVITSSLTIDGAGPNYCSDAGSTDDYACNLVPALTAYAPGGQFSFKANTVNTGVATINLNGLGAKTIKKAAGGITTDLANADIRAGQIVYVTYDGTNMQMQSGLGNAASGGGTPAGSTNDVQLNTGGSFAADTGVFTYVPGTHVLGTTSMDISTGAFSCTYVTKLANYTLGQHDCGVEGITNAFNVTLPLASSYPGKHYWVKNLQTANVVTVLRTGSDTIDGATSAGIANGSAEYQSDGVSSWRTVSAAGYPIGTLTQGDTIQVDANNHLTLVPKSTTATRYWANTGTNNNGQWDQVNLGNGVTGTLPFSNLTTIANNTVLGNIGGSTTVPGAVTGLPVPQPILYLAGVSQAGTASIACNTPSSGAATAVSAASTTYPTGVMSFSGTVSTPNEVECMFITPSDWTSASTLDITLYWRSGTGQTSGAVVWSVATLFAGANVAWNGSANTASTVTTTVSSTASGTTLSSISGVTATGIGASKLGWVKIGRLTPASGSDTMTGGAELAAFILTIRRTPQIGG